MCNNFGNNSASDSLVDISTVVLSGHVMFTWAKMSNYQISQSSLLTLKAEILRKQQELSKAKADNEVKREMIKKKTPLELKNKGDEVRKRFDNIEEDEDLLKQSSIALQQKAKVYEELSSGKLDPADHRAFLVRFDKNSSEDVPPICSDDVLNKCEEDADECYDTDEELDTSEKWVTYTDCLGRTRQCMAKDLEHIKRNDKKLREVVEKKRMQHGREEEIAAKSNEVTEKNEHVEEGEALPEMMSDQLRNEILRKQWEKDEERLKDKKDVHYQDVLFGEARSHGVGYYGFSTDENERLRQQEALKKLRNETEEKQAQARRLKEMRDQQLAVRIKAAKDRKRMRLGLPPEEDEPRKPQKPCESEEEKEKREEEQKERETAEKKLEKLRKKHVRPWDIGKEGVTIFEEMAQDEWLEKKRDERPHEFAPPQTYTKRQNFRSTVKKEAVQGGYKKEGLKFSTIKNSKNYNKAKNKMSDFEKIPLSQPILSTPVQDEPCGDFDNALLEDCRKFSNQIKSNVYNAEANYGASETKRGRLAENNNDFQNNILADYRRSMEQSDPNVHSFGASPDFEYVIMTHPPKTMSGGIKIGESPPPYFKRGNDRSDFEDALMVHPKKSVAGTHHNKINFGESRSFFKRESDRDHFEDTIMTEKVASLSSRNVEIPSSDFEDPLLADYRSRSSQNDRGNSIEVPPPPTFNYYGPSRRGTKEKVAKLGGDEIEKSIEAGLKLLRKQVEEKEKSKGRPDEIFLL